MKKKEERKQTTIDYPVVLEETESDSHMTEKERWNSKKSNSPMTNEERQRWLKYINQKDVK